MYTKKEEFHSKTHPLKMCMEFATFGTCMCSSSCVQFTGVFFLP